MSMNQSKYQVKMVTSWGLHISSKITALLAISLFQGCYLAESFNPSSYKSRMFSQTAFSVNTNGQYNSVPINLNLHHFQPSHTLLYSSNPEIDDGSSKNEGIDVDSDPRLYKIRIARAPGIEWGTDLSFSFVYVRALEPAGPASLSGLVSVGDQICQLQPVVEDGTNETEETAPTNLVGASFDAVMNSFATLDRSVKLVDLVFFKGTKEELKAAAEGKSPGESNQDDDTITITVVKNKGAPNEETLSFKAKTGCNVRNELVERGINVYQSITRFTNCKGKQLCGTCIVNMAEGAINTNRKSMDEASTLRENPDSYRLSCVTFAYGDITVETYPPVNKAQWTR